MARWEYLTFSIGYDKKKHKTWTLVQSNGEELVGLNSILQAYGAEGWELVDLETQRFLIIPGFGKYYMDPAEYRATFKRQLK